MNSPKQKELTMSIMRVGWYSLRLAAHKCQWLGEVDLQNIITNTLNGNGLANDTLTYSTTRKLNSSYCQSQAQWEQRAQIYPITGLYKTKTQRHPMKIPTKYLKVKSQKWLALRAKDETSLLFKERKNQKRKY